jgi:hypothetical protein
VLDLRGAIPGSKLTCSFCGVEHEVPDTEKKPDKGTNPGEKALVVMDDDDLQALIAEYDGMAESPSRRPASVDVADEWGDEEGPGRRRRSKELPPWVYIVGYLGFWVMFALIGWIYVHQGGYTVQFDDRIKSPLLWAGVIFGSVVLGLGMWLISVVVKHKASQQRRMRRPRREA